MLPPAGHLRSSREICKMGEGCRRSRKAPRTLINRTPGGDGPELLDAVAADADIPVVEVDGRVAMAGDQADLVAERAAAAGGEREPGGGDRDGEAAVLVGGALVGRGGLITDQRRARVEGERLETGI